jgi:DNA-binding NtrC family response regulator
MNFPKHVLIVEDNSLHLDILETAFSQAGAISVVKASDGFEAKQLLDKADRPFDLMVLDLCLPGFDGFEILSVLISSAADTRFVLLSGMPKNILHMAEEISNKKKLRIIGSLQKPISIAELMDVVKRQDWTDDATLAVSDAS